LQSFLHITWIDDWLAGLVHPSRRADPVERSRHERFLASRTASTVAALVGLPPYLLGYGVPTTLEGLALLALAAPFAALVLLFRTGRLAPAQTLVSLALAAFAAAAVASFGGITSPAVLALAIVPLDALFSGSRRAIFGAVATAIASLVLAVALEAAPIGPANGLTAVFVVGLALGFGHAVAQIVSDHRLSVMLRLARNAGEARENATFQAIDDLVTWHDRNGSVLRANAAATKLTGAPASLLQGHGLFDRVHVADRPAYLKAISDAATSPEPVSVCLRLQVGEGPPVPCRPEPVPSFLAARAWPRVIWVEMRAHRLPAAGDGSCTVVAVTRDISEHRRHADELEAARRRAEHANDSRARLLVAASQELRTPLDAIIAYAELMARRDSPPAVGSPHDYPRLIGESGRHMLGVVSTLLDLATIEAGHYDLAPESLAMTELVDEGCRSMQVLAERAGITVVQAAAPHLPPVRADRRACRQILVNLLANAVAFTPRGGLITVQVRRDGDRVALAVRDTGIGVVPTELSRLAEPFYRASSALGCGERGSGLGLTVVRDLAALQGGRVTFAPGPGGGLAATVTLPIDAGRTNRAEEAARIHTLPRFSDGALAIRTG
jgi:cell cycle sensor histidine kinase DivJ